MSNLYPGSYQVPPMRFANKPPQTVLEQVFESKNWIAQEKKDGAWYQLEKTAEGNIYLFGRTVSKKTGEYTEKIENVPHIKKWAENNLPNGTVVVGEIYVPGGKSNDVTKIMGCTASNAYMRQFKSNEYGGPIHYYIFDCIRYANKDLCDEPYMYRLDSYLNNKIWSTTKDEDYIEVAESWDSNFEEHLQKIFAAGGEGCVFKKKDSIYKPDKRATVRESFKYKEHLDSIDLICMELLDPVMEYTGKELDTWPYWYDAEQDHLYHWSFDPNNPLTAPYSFDDVPGIEPVTKPFYYGWKNAMRLGAYRNGTVVEVGRVASGLTDELREDMATHPENYLNKVIEVECMSTTKDGALRHPVFRRVREDKGPQDCLWDEIFN